ncbi:hypothetical protein F5Y03DRAFT_365426 [Xylaria venustula]|nr:hypothetical protein F5Y03DRAFT_365426 [Xylaria venustula]
MKSILVTFVTALASFALADPVADADSLESTQWHRSSTTTTPPFIVTTLPTTLPTSVPTWPPLACPTVTITTRPAGCQPIRCPIPGCTYEQDMVIPCGCDVKTLLWVEGCQTACPEGCATKTSTLTELCATAVPTLAA